MSEINPTDHKSITARHFPDEDYREADRESVESYGPNNRDYSESVHHVWYLNPEITRCLDPEITKDFERIWRLSAKN